MLKRLSVLSLVFVAGCWSCGESVRGSSTQLRVSVDTLIEASQPRADVPAAVWSNLATATSAHARSLEARAAE